MNLGLFVVFLTFLTPLILVIYVKTKVRGKMLCYFVRKDKSVLGKLCELRSDFVIFGDRAYEVYPDFVRVARWPMGWPSFLQELVPAALYDEEDAIPLDWVNLDNRLERAMNLRSALDENWIKKLVHEAAAEGAGFRINWRKVIPIALIALGALGLIILLVSRFAGR